MPKQKILVAVKIPGHKGAQMFEAPNKRQANAFIRDLKKDHPSVEIAVSPPGIFESNHPLPKTTGKKTRVYGLLFPPGDAPKIKQIADLLVGLSSELTPLPLARRLAAEWAFHTIKAYRRATGMPEEG